MARKCKGKSNSCSVVQGRKEPISASREFLREGLAEFKLDVFRCMRPDADDPDDLPVWSGVLDDLDRQTSSKPLNWGAGQTLLYSKIVNGFDTILMEGFSPPLVQRGIAEKCLRMVLDRTRFRIRILTDNSVVGSPQWIDFFKSYPGRFIIGLSIGTQDDQWAKRIAPQTPSPSARIRALRNLQDANIPTYAMLCPLFPEILEGQEFEQLLAVVRPSILEHIWVEPFCGLYPEGARRRLSPTTKSYSWLYEVFGKGQYGPWSRFSTELYVRLRDKATMEGWLNKLSYLLDESRILPEDAAHFIGMKGVVLKNEPGSDGKSRFPAIAALQV